MELKAGDSGIGCIALRDFAVGDTIMEVREMGEVYGCADGKEGEQRRDFDYGW